MMPTSELDYTWALVMLAALGIAALLISVYLKSVDKSKGYVGLTRTTTSSKIRGRSPLTFTLTICLS